MAVIKGFGEVNHNLSMAVKSIKGRTMAGLLEAAAYIRHDMDKTPPKIPVGRTGNLRQSWFVTSFRVLGNPAVLMGFSANYAAFVHEMGESGATAGKKINWNRPGSGAKFFESALVRNHDEVLQIIKDRAKV